MCVKILVSIKVHYCQLQRWTKRYSEHILDPYLFSDLIKWQLALSNNNNNSLLAQLTPNIGSKVTNKQKRIKHIHKQQLSYTSKQKGCFTIKQM